MSLNICIWNFLAHVCHRVVVHLFLGIDIQVIFLLFRGIDQLSPFCNCRLVSSAFSHPYYPAIWIEVCCGVELHYELLIPLCELLPNKVCNSTSSEAVKHSRIVFFILLDVLPVDPPHITYYGFLVQQHCLIEVLLFLCVEPVVNSSPSPC